MADIILTADEYERLQAVVNNANELIKAIPYITAAGGNVTRQNMQVVKLSKALEAVAGIVGRKAGMTETTINVDRRTLTLPNKVEVVIDGTVNDVPAGKVTIGDNNAGNADSKRTRATKK